MDRLFRQMSSDAAGLQEECCAPLCVPGEVVMVRSFENDEQFDYKPEVRGHEHVGIVEECSEDGVVVRLLHRDPDGFAEGRPDIVSHDEDVPRRGCRDDLVVEVAVADVIKLVPESVQIGVRKATFRGYTEQFLNTCGGSQIAGMYNAYHKLEAPHRNRTVDREVWDTAPPDRRAHGKRKTAVKFAQSAIRKSAWDGGTAASWSGKKAADTWHGLELLASSVNAARRGAILDEDNPRTWKCGNADIVRALEKVGIRTEVVASQPECKKSGASGWAKSEQEEAKAWIWQQVKARFDEGPLMFHVYTQSKEYLKSNVHPKDSPYKGGGDGHYALVFAWVEGVTCDGVHFRRVLTARNYQAPRHWVDVHDIYDQMRWGQTELRVAPLEGSRSGAPAARVPIRRALAAVNGHRKAAPVKTVTVQCAAASATTKEKTPGKRWR